ncbi:hypothetical protein DPEC_G00165670 [Dallia pectoralis]|uniref:Uncharacterized protein n=1 Tax=Dallia pectoralis TaxID=75939 RepID=A0ACC2GHS3_DALPE|nr:hypothetical protein DPEC_G00165670 [Dallia pectoralis]
MENIYANFDRGRVKFQPDTDIAGNNKAKCNYLRCAAVSLGLLCVVLLAAIIGVCVYYRHSSLETERDNLTKPLGE